MPRQPTMYDCVSALKDAIWLPWLSSHRPLYRYGIERSDGTLVNTGLLDDRVDRYFRYTVCMGNLIRERTVRDGVSRRSTDCQCFGAARRPRWAAIVTRSGSDSAFILRMT